MRSPLGLRRRSAGTSLLTHKPRTLNDLKEAIRQEIRPIDRQLLARVMDDLKTASKTVVILPK